MSVIIIGSAVVDYLGTVSRFPLPDEKIRSEQCEIAMGGNALNASITLRRLGIGATVLTKLGNDYLGEQINDCLKKEGVITNLIVMKENMTSSFSYIILDRSSKTRTVVNNPCEELENLSEIRNNENLFEGINLLVTDGKHPRLTCHLLQLANQKNIPVLLDAETECVSSPFFNEIMERADYVKCGEALPSLFTKKDDLLEAMDNILSRGESFRKKFVCTTLGANGSIILQRHINLETSCKISCFEELKENFQNQSDDKIKHFNYQPKNFIGPSSIITYCPAYKDVEIYDTTGAGDVFLGSMAYSILNNHSPEKILSTGSVVASLKCRFSGIKGIPMVEELDYEWIKSHS